MRTILNAGAAAGALLGLGLGLGSADANTLGDTGTNAEVSVPECLEVAMRTVPGEPTNVEFVSRNGEPYYEFILDDDIDVYYIACNAQTGLIQGVDKIAGEEDSEFSSMARIEDEQAGRIATNRYPGEIEEIKGILRANGDAMWEIDIEREEGAGIAFPSELNVWINAQTGTIEEVVIEYWEIGATGGEEDDDD